MGRVAAKRPGGAHGGQGVTNHIHDGVDLLMHRAAWEAQGFEALPAQNAVANGVVFLLLQILVVRTIHLDHQPAIEADEVEDIASERSLPSYVEAIAAELPKPRPQTDFGETHGFPKSSGALDAHGATPPDRFAATLPIEGRESIQWSFKDVELKNGAFLS
jgi:hypothetical protein